MNDDTATSSADPLAVDTIEAALVALDAENSTGAVELLATYITNGLYEVEAHAPDPATGFGLVLNLWRAHILDLAHAAVTVAADELNRGRPCSCPDSMWSLQHLNHTGSIEADVPAPTLAALRAVITAANADTTGARDILTAAQRASDARDPFDTDDMFGAITECLKLIVSIRAHRGAGEHT